MFDFVRSSEAFALEFYGSRTCMFIGYKESVKERERERIFNCITRNVNVV